MFSDIGIIGAGAIGGNLALNLADNRHKVVVFDLDSNKVQKIIDDDETNRIKMANSVQDLVDSLKSPRIVILSVKAGSLIDNIVQELHPLLNEKDIIVDGGNSNFKDTIKRTKQLSEIHIEFVGMGISGGSYGARNGPSLMVGGSEYAWSILGPVLKSIAANYDGNPCCDHIGPDGAGHFVKTIHNGIEYGIMQLISEMYQLMRDGFELTNLEISNIFDEWNKEELQSYLIEITAIILRKETQEGLSFIDTILDKAAQKGTGRWSAELALELGVSATIISSSVFQRIISSFKEDRVALTELYEIKPDKIVLDDGIQTMHDALHLGIVLSYVQGFLILYHGSIEYNWNLNYSSISKIWGDGCIIRAKILEDFEREFAINPKLSNLLYTNFLIDLISSNHEALKNITVSAIKANIAIPCLSSAFNFVSSYLSGDLPTNLIQAQRNYFGDHLLEFI